MMKQFVKKRLFNIVIAFGAIFLIFFVIYMVRLGRKGPSNSEQSNVPSLLQVTAEVGTQKDIELISSDGKVRVYVPRNAITSHGWLSLSVREPDIFSDAGELFWTRPLIANLDLYDAKGKLINHPSFKLSISICFYLEKSEWLLFKNYPQNYKIQFYNEILSNPKWEDLPLGIKNEKSEICGQVNHLSLFALAVYQPNQQTPNPLGPYSPVGPYNP
jgi:hypothetical protein